MDNKNIVIDVNSIAKTNQLMNSECDKLVALLVKYRGMFDETNDFKEKLNIKCEVLLEKDIY